MNNKTIHNNAKKFAPSKAGHFLIEISSKILKEWVSNNFFFFEAALMLSMF